MISQTSSAAMEQRKTFLKKAAINPNVRSPDRVVAKYLAQTYLTAHGDTPKSVLSASQLPFFSDEENEDDVEQQLNGHSTNGHSNGHHGRKKSSASDKNE